MRPELQSICVFRQESAAVAEPYAVHEFMFARFADDECVDADDFSGVLQQSIAANGHCMHLWEERRGKFSWGAEGPLLQELVIALAIGTSGSAVWDGLKTLVTALVARRRATSQDIDAGTAVATAMSACRTAFQLSEDEVARSERLDVEAGDEGWLVGLVVGGVHYSAQVDRQGSLVRAIRSQAEDR